MSKLLEKLRRAAQAESQRIGFGIQPREPKRATMVLVAELPSPDAGLVRRAAEAGADALLIAGWRRPDDLRPVKEHAGQIPWGVRLPDQDEGRVQPLIDAGCDYVALSPTTRATVLCWEKIDKALELSPAMPDTRLRAVSTLPIAMAFLTDTTEGPLTIDDLLDFTRLAVASRKPTVLRARKDVMPADLVALRESGVDGVMIQAIGADWTDRLRQFREAIDTLPPRTRRETAVEPVLPQPRGVEQLPQTEDDE